MILLIGLVIAIIGTLGFALSPVPDFLLKRLAVPYSQIQLHNVLYLAIVFLALLFLAMGLATWIGGFFGSIDHADSEQVVNKGCESATGTTEACNQPKKKKDPSIGKPQPPQTQCANGCTEEIAPGWSVVLTQPGRAETMMSGDSRVTSHKDRLPTKDECAGIAGFAERKGILSSALSGKTDASVWCKQDDQVGVCIRRVDEQDWIFNFNLDNDHDAYLILHN